MDCFFIFTTLVTPFNNIEYNNINKFNELIALLGLLQINSLYSNAILFGLFIVLIIFGGIFIILKHHALYLLLLKAKYELKSHKNEQVDEDNIHETIKMAGYAYDESQDIFYSVLDAWQRGLGYCRLYDEAAAPLGMIIDCEPIYFTYNDQHWLIEFWKGQYDLTTGCEVGVYVTNTLDLSIPDAYKDTFYEAVSDEDLLLISYSLSKDGEVLFRRQGHHWWLTGFKLGEFSEPGELTMDIAIALKDRQMRDAFVQSLLKVGYTEENIKARGNQVSLKFDQPYSPQPNSRTKGGDWLIQRKNEWLCETYQELTKGYDGLDQKLLAVKEQSPELYNMVLNIGKSKEIFEEYKKIEKYLK